MRIRILLSRTLYVVLGLSLVGLFPTRTAAWGSNGHRIIARIAMDRLSSNARQSVMALLEPDETLETVSTWADQIKLKRRETMSWHYVLIGVKFTNYIRSRDCREGVCIIEAIEKQKLILKNPNSPPKDGAEALKFLVHLIGDLHEPFHVTNNDDPPDSGASLVKVTFLNGRPTNLHAVWDDDIINYAMRQSRQDVAEYASQLSAGISKGYISTEGTVTTWALEAHQLAWNAYYLGNNFMYLDKTKPRVWNLDDGYYRKNKGMVDIQMVRAGVRLAAVLNEVFSQTK